LKKNKVFYNGRIYTQADGIIADSMAVRGDRIVAIGRDLEHDSQTRGFAKIDLKGLTVIPGLADAHTHFYYLAMAQSDVHLDGLMSFDEVLAAIETHAATLGADEWVIGQGFAPDSWKKHVDPDKDMLDKVTGRHPAAIFSKDMHTLWVNSRALKLAGLSDKTVDPEGGRIERQSDGEPTGLFREKPAFEPVLDRIRPPSPGRLRRLFKKAVAATHSRGVTSVHSFDGIEALDFFTGLAAAGQLDLRINQYPPAEKLPLLKKRGIRPEIDDARFAVSGVKIFADGSLGSQTAYCFNKYPGSDNNYGVEVTTQSEMLTLIREAAELGLPCAIHAIGDRAVANVIDCFEQAPPLDPPTRHRVEHVQMIRRKDIPRFARLDLTASVQPTHCSADVNMIDKYWGKRGRNCYIFKTMFKNRIPLAFGSDAPIEPLDPLAGIYSAVTRLPRRGSRGFYPEERLSVAEAVFASTVGPAFAVGEHHLRGALRPDLKADFVVLARDIYRRSPTSIAATHVEATFLDGSPVFVNDPCSLKL